MRAVLHRAAPGLTALPMSVSDEPDLSKPLWAAVRIRLGDRACAKLAFSEPTAVRIWREAQALWLLGSLGLPVPELLASAHDPAFVATGLVRGADPLSYAAVAAARPDHVEAIAAQIARFLAQLHAPTTHVRAEMEMDSLTAMPERGLHASTEDLRVRFTPMLTSGQRRLVNRWCDWADEQLSAPAERVLVHGDFHPYNQLWDLQQLRLLAVIDLETCGLGEREFDFRILPVFGPGVELLVAVIAHYERLAERRLSLQRIMAHHLLNYLGDAMWRTEAGIALPEPGETPGDYVEEAAGRLATLGIAP